MHDDPCAPSCIALPFSRIGGEGRRQLNSPVRHEWWYDALMLISYCNPRRVEEESEKDATTTTKDQKPTRSRP
jgi:hypothetical protein